MKKTLYTILVLFLILLSSCLSFKNIDQPVVSQPNTIIVVPITATTEGGETEPYFGVCLPVGWTIPGDSVQWSGVYNEVIYYDDSISAVQNYVSPAPAGYYWWAGKGAAVSTDSGDASAELQIKTDDQVGTFSIDYMLGYPYDPCGGGGGVNFHRSNGHQIDIVSEFTPAVLQDSIINRKVLLTWIAPVNTNGLLGYYVYRDEQQINPILLTSTTFLDENPLAGLHSYCVSSMYNDGNEYLMPYEVEVRSVQSDSLYVSPDGDDSNSGMSFNEPLQTINCAISILESDSLYPKTIFLAEGVYSPGTNGEVFPLGWKDYVSLEGISKETSIIDGDSLGGVVQFDSITAAMLKNLSLRNIGNIHCDNSNPEFKDINISDNTGDGIYCNNSNPVLRNVIVTGNNGCGINCNNNSNPSLEGVKISENEGRGVCCTNGSSPILVDAIINDNNEGGVYCDNNSNPIFENVDILNNSSNMAGGGGGIYCTQNSSPVITNVTITDNEGRGVYCSNSSSPRIEYVTIENNDGGVYCEENSSPILKGVSIKNNSDASYGGGIYCENSSPILDSVFISNNSASGDGGGIYFKNNSNSQLTNVRIEENNSGHHGGGIFCLGSDPTLLNVKVINNSSINGGGIYFIESDPMLQNVEITNNNGYNGGGICCTQSTTSLQNVIVANNNSDSRGGGIYCDKSTLLLLNTLISGNSVVYSSAGIHCIGGSNVILKNCILWNDSSGEIYFSQFSTSNLTMISYSNIQGGEAGIITNNNGTVYWLEGNMDEDPLFISTGDFPYALSGGSSSVDAGDPNSIYNDPEDPNNSGYALWPAMGTLRNDMGAYGGPNSASWYITTDIDEDENKEIQAPTRFELSQNYPNPFNPSTVIQYCLKERSSVELVLYDILGRQTEVLVKEEQDAGYYKINFNAGRLASGIYFYRIQAGNFVETKKMILIK